MRATGQRFRPAVRLSRRVFAPLERFARLTGMSCSDVVELVLAEMFEDEVARPDGAPASPPAPRRVGRRRAGPATVIPITRARAVRAAIACLDRIEPAQLRQRAAQLRARAQGARARAAAACEAATRARQNALRLRRLPDPLGGP